MTALLPIVLFPLLLWGGALQTNTTMEDDGGTLEITEDKESFQAQDNSSFSRCNETLLKLHSYICQDMFAEEMSTTDKELWCDWQSVIRPYNKLTRCMEYITGVVGCFFPNHVVQEAFLQVHSFYFQHCGDQEDGFNVAPHYVAVSLTLVPVCLIPILVSLVVWKSKVRE